MAKLEVSGVFLVRFTGSRCCGKIRGERCLLGKVYWEQMLWQTTYFSLAFTFPFLRGFLTAFFFESSASIYALSDL